MPSKRTPRSRLPIRVGLDDVDLVDLLLTGESADAFKEFDYQPAELIAFYHEHEEALLREFERRRLRGRPWVISAYGIRRRPRG